MSPNPVVLLINVVNVKKWFAKKSAPQERVRGRFEHRNLPVPGYYEYRPGRGLLLVAVDEDDGHKLDQPIPIIYSKLLHRDMLEPEYKARQKTGSISDESGKKRPGTFFRLDDGFTWVYWRDQDGKLDESPRRRRLCIDAETGKFRPLTSADCTIDGQGISIASRSIRSSVNGDVWSITPGSVTTSSTSTTRPSTIPSTRRNSSSATARRQSATPSPTPSPPLVTTAVQPKLNEHELDQRLLDLTRH